LEDFGEELSSVLMSPGRSIQSLSMSAEEAWVKLYKATPASRDTQISYYRLGAAVAFCLDVRLRSFGSSLPVLLRHLWSFFGEQRRGFCRDDLHPWLSSVDSALPAELDHWLDDTNAIPLEHSAGLMGLRLEPVQQKTPHHGLNLKLSAGDLVVQRVMKNSPGMRASLVVGDEILAINGFRVRCIDAVADLMRNCSEVQVSFVRRGLMKETLLQPETAIESWRLDFDPQASSDQLALREQWFKIF
jgi:predicted metalloprotease with PDZ domain